MRSAPGWVGMMIKPSSTVYCLSSAPAVIKPLRHQISDNNSDNYLGKKLWED